MMNTPRIHHHSIKSVVVAFTILMISPALGCDKLALNSLPNVDQEDINHLHDSTPTAAPTQNLIENQKGLLKQKNLYVWDDAFIPDDKVEEKAALAFAAANYMMKVISPSIYNEMEDKVKFAKGCETMFFWHPECSFFAYKLLAMTDLTSKRGPVLGDLTRGLMDGSISCSKVSELLKQLEIQEIIKEDFSDIKDKFCSIDPPFDPTTNHNDNLNAPAVGLITPLLEAWNTAMNQHDAEAVANTHTNSAIIRGKEYTIASYRDKEAKAFQKHPDFTQTPSWDSIYIAPMPNEKGFFTTFNETFSQGGKDTNTEIMLVVVREGSGFKIAYESDISTDRNLLKKMGLNTYTTSSNCKQLNGQIVMESPMFRHGYIPSESLSLVCEKDECSIGVGENGIVGEFYEFDHNAMKMTVKDAMTNKGITYHIHPKYASQIQKLCL